MKGLCGALVTVSASPSGILEVLPEKLLKHARNCKVGTGRFRSCRRRITTLFSPAFLFFSFVRFALVRDLCSETLVAGSLAGVRRHCCWRHLVWVDGHMCEFWSNSFFSLHSIFKERECDEQMQSSIIVGINSSSYNYGSSFLPQDAVLPGESPGDATGLLLMNRLEWLEQTISIFPL